jgi:GT2 family glycosyltransferase
MRKLLENTPGTAGYARILVDRGEGRTFLKPPRAIREGENMATYLLCERGFIPTSTMVVERKMAEAIRFHENLAAAEDTDFAIRLALAGQRFVMAQEPGVQWNDSGDPGRLSAGRKSATMRQWIEDLRAKIPAKAYYGCLGWAYAKHVAMSDRFAALKLYLAAFVRGCYRPSLVAIVFLQIFLSDSAYRKLADTAIARFGAGLRPGSAP